MEKLSEILKDLEQGKISADNAEEQVLRLFNVSGRSELLVDFCEKVIWKDHRVHIHTDVINSYLKSTQFK